jgi:hypothetical protein
MTARGSVEEAIRMMVPTTKQYRAGIAAAEKAARGWLDTPQDQRIATARTLPDSEAVSLATHIVGAFLAKIQRG